MKSILTIAIFNLLFLNLVYGQETDSNFRKIETGNWLELSYRPLNEQGEEAPFCYVEEMPHFPGGFDALAKFIVDTLKYPPTALHDSMQGCVYTRFVVDKNGKVTRVETIRGVRKDLDDACVWAISLLPDWTKPKSAYNYNISVQFILPIRFIIKND
jgi:TonB family protein